MTADITASVRAALIEELEQLRIEVRTIVDGLSDSELWRKPLDPGNPVGHLVLHLTGNLNHFVGAQLSNTGNVRDREREFTEANPPTREELMTNLDRAVATFRHVVDKLTAEQLISAHPEKRFGTVIKTLLHLVAHFALHRGQMSYIVRIVKPG